jgi:hypothetical protein
MSFPRLPFSIGSTRTTVTIAAKATSEYRRPFRHVALQRCNNARRLSTDDPVGLDARPTKD